MISFQKMITLLNLFWEKQGCLLLQPLDMEVGAGTFQPGTFLRAIGPEPWNAAYVQLSRRPTDGRYGEHPNRQQIFHQYQVVLKPSPNNIQALYLESLKVLGIDCTKHDIRFVEDNWEAPTLGAWGLGWEVWCDGMEITQFTYFQQVGGLPCDPIMGEITYGLERLALYLQGVDHFHKILWTDIPKPIYYGELYQQYEKEMSRYNFVAANTDILSQWFIDCEKMCQDLLTQELPLPAYEMVVKASHIFNLLDARQAISVSQRQNMILAVRKLACQVAKHYLIQRQTLNFPLL